MTVKRVLGWAVLAVLLVAGEATAGAVLADGVVKWAYVGWAVVVAGCGVAAERWLFRAPGPTLRLRDGRRGAPVFHDVAMTDLGVHRSRLARAAGETYVERDIDGAVQAAVSTGRRLVLVHGPVLAGATRTLVEAVRKERPGVRLVAFEPDRTATLARRVEQARRWKRADDYGGVALWLDHLGGPELFEITTELLNSAENHGVHLLATAASDDVEAVEHSRPDDPRLAVIGVGAATGSERTRLLAVPAFREVTEAHADTPVLLGRLLVSLEQVERHMTPAVPEDQERVALVRAVVDWHRLGVPLPLTKRDLAGLFSLYLGAVLGLSHRPETDPGRLNQALQGGLQRRGDLDQPLIHQQGRKRDTTFRPHPLLAALADSDSPAAWPLQPEIWTYLYATTSGSRRHQLGLYAYGRGLLLEASELLIVDTNNGLDPAVMHLLGHAEEVSNPDHARTWWQRAVDSDHPDYASAAMVDLGVLEKDQGVVDQARHWYQQAVNSDHPDYAPAAMVNLGNLEKDQGVVDQARHWYQQAVNSDHPDNASAAMVNLGFLEEDQGVVDQARHWYQRVIDSSHPQYTPMAKQYLRKLTKFEHEQRQAKWIAHKSSYIDENWVPPR